MGRSRKGKSRRGKALEERVEGVTGVVVVALRKRGKVRVKGHETVSGSETGEKNTMSKAMSQPIYLESGMIKVE